MTGSNGKITDEGLTALNAAFKGAKYLEDDAKRCAELMCVGKHRELELSDAAAMQLYALVTEGKKAQVSRRGSTGAGYSVNIESYADLLAFFDGSLDAIQLDSQEAANDN